MIIAGIDPGRVHDELHVGCKQDRLRCGGLEEFEVTANVLPLTTNTAAHKKLRVML
jgi:hypothetical protein